ncbi:SsgA family sporulation/cell division regulator [Nonomuraea bangladeshensis]|uniref:SsgA family sporulation/cell division regulator n=1 Tax=Nonomuraea bangladeshensis TaxID=404385 RepID=UPI0031DD60C7
MKGNEVIADVLMWTVDYQPVAALLRYTAEDPFAVTLDFVDDAGRVTASYRFARTLLTARVWQPVAVVPCDLVVIDPAREPGTTSFILALDHDTLPMAFLTETAPLVEFLRDSYEVIPPGSEGYHLDMDSIIAGGS